ncbi:MAG: tRNA uridine-5-carboxymethylaminomethyl(34) synthesis enzyme MnmG [bacterium]
MNQIYDVLVVGAGHAGCEAAYASSKMGMKTLLVTLDMGKIAQMSCNPAMGGIAKGQIIREIDALGGLSGIITDKSSIQFRMLNRSKGPAMWSPRAQCDRKKFSEYWRLALEKVENLDFLQDMVIQLIIDKGNVRGVKTLIGFEIFAKSVILTMGTFQNGLMHVGKKNFKGGRISESASYGISEQLSEYGFEVDRMKTGTPARLDGRSINFNKLDEQPSDLEGGRFSYVKVENKLKYRSCFIAFTNSDCHGILKKGFEDSPLFQGIIKGRGPRYCPSIEDKIVTFADKEKHQLFIEPEGEETVEFYINGFSSSLPFDIQLEALRKIEGLENVKFFRPGYAIEYDYYPPTQLNATLETKEIGNLYFAGQINGTTGYEEAAAQGLMAGINATLKIKRNEPLVLRRDQAYIGVLIDDLITKGVDEPYRMFTSRAEYRILLRQDNADQRLTRIGYEIGLASPERLDNLTRKEKNVESLIKFCQNKSIKPGIINKKLLELNTTELNQSVKLINILMRPQVSIRNLEGLIPGFDEFFQGNIDKQELLESAEIIIKYAGYIEREKLNADKIQRLENIRLSENIDYNQFQSISTEGKQKLNRIKPGTIAQASRIPGVSPADISVLLIYLGR